MTNERNEINGAPERPLILSFDDRPENNLFIRLILEAEGFSVLSGINPEKALEVCKEENPDVILLSIAMQKSGFDICRELKKDEDTTAIPIIFMAEQDTSASEIAEGLKVGSNDFIRRPFNPIELIARIRVALRIKRAEEAVRKLLAVDAMTGLYNRMMMFEFFVKEIERSKRYGDPLSLLLLDVDRFKEINDTHGHHAGDEALKQIAETLIGSFRKTDICCRYGGDEFCVVLPKTTLENALELAERLVGNVRGFPLQYEGKEIPLSVTVGISTREYYELGLLPDLLVKEADIAMLHAKRGDKKGGVLCFDPSLEL